MIEGVSRMGDWKKTICCKCGAACGLEIEVENDKIVSVRPDEDSPRSHGYCCRKGRASKYYLDNPDRLNYPLKKVGDHYERISWKQAYQEIGEKSKKILEEHGPRSFAMLGGVLASGQSAAAMGTTTMKAIGSQYIYNSVGIEFMGNWWSHGKILGSQANFLEADDPRVEVFIFWGSNSYVTHQIGEARWTIREISENPDKMVICVDPRLSETARMSDLHVQVRPGTDSLFIRALISMILKQGLQDQAYLDKRTADFDKVKPWFHDFDIDEALRVCKVPKEVAEKFVTILTTKKWGVHQDLGLFCGRHNTMNSYLLLILQAVCGMLLVDGGNIIQFGYTPLGETIHEEDPKVWRTMATNKFPVLGMYPESVLAREITSDNPNHLRVLFASDTNPLRSYPNTNELKDAFEQLDLLVVIDICETETTKMADYVLPGKTGFEAPDFSVFQGQYPVIDCVIKHPIIGQIGERREDATIWMELAECMNVIPKIPQSLHDAAAKAVETGDRIPYLLKLMMFAAKNKKAAEILPIVVGETLGRRMGSVVESLLWAALASSPLAGTGKCERAGFGPGKKHKIMQLVPALKNAMTMDQVFQKVIDTPQGAIIAKSELGEAFEYNIKHQDKKLHLYCDEINEYIKKITPEQEEKDLIMDEEFPLLLSAGRHADDGHNTTMRNPKTYNYRNPYVLALNPDDGDKFHVADGQMVKVITRAGEAEIPVEYTYQAAPGFAIFPHHFGLEVDGVCIGQAVNLLTETKNMEEITGNPLIRYVPCRIEII